MISLPSGPRTTTTTFHRWELTNKESTLILARSGILISSTSISRCGYCFELDGWLNRLEDLLRTIVDACCRELEGCWRELEGSWRKLEGSWRELEGTTTTAGGLLGPESDGGGGTGSGGVYRRYFTAYTYMSLMSEDV